jgi:glycosyltransferase involved in cell wall biosynthesis
VYPLARANYIRTRSRLKKYLKRYHPVVAHSTGFEADVLLRMAAEDLDTPIVNSIHCAGWPARRGPGTPRTLRRKLDAKTIGRVDALMVDCTELGTKLAGAGIPVRRLVYDPPSIDLAEARTLSEKEPGVAFEDGIRYVGYAGRLERSRGLETLVAAEREIVRGRRDVRLMFAGAGPARAGIVVASAGRGSVILPGKVASVPAVLARLGVCVFPSSEHGTPTSLLEAAALGRPIVASAVPGIEELFEDGSEISLVPSGDARALAARIGRLLDDPESAVRMGEAARLRTTDTYSSAAAVARSMTLYRELAAL